MPLPLFTISDYEQNQLGVTPTDDDNLDIEGLFNGNEATQDYGADVDDRVGLL